MEKVQLATQRVKVQRIPPMEKVLRAIPTIQKVKVPRAIPANHTDRSPSPQFAALLGNYPQLCIGRIAIPPFCHNCTLHFHFPHCKPQFLLSNDNLCGTHSLLGCSCSESMHQRHTALLTDKLCQRLASLNSCKTHEIHSRTIRPCRQCRSRMWYLHPPARHHH